MEDSPNTWSASTVNYLIPTQQEGYGAPTSTGRLLSRGRPSLGRKRTLGDISKIRCTSSSVGHISCLPNLKTIAFASQHFTAAMIRSQCWFTFDFILHQIFWSPLLNDVKQLLIAAIMPSKVRFFHSPNLGIDDGPAILHDVVFWKKIPSKEWTFLTSLDTLAFNRGALPHDFLGKHLAIDVCPPHPFEWACSNNVRSFFLCWKEGRVPLEGPFVRDTSQDHKSSGKCPPGFPLTTSGILWYEPVLEVIVERRISWFPSSS